MTVGFEIVDDPARVCAAMMISGAIGGGEIVLAGGSTPKAAYAQLVRAVQTIGFDLSRTTFWLGDERCVEPEDERSNYRMIKETLLDPLPDAMRPTVRRIKGELGPDRAADDYDRALRDAGPPDFDLVLLGIGSDGHTASLFPGKPAVAERRRLAVGVPEAGLEPFVARVSMTVSALAAGQRVVFLAAGESKADAIARAFGAAAGVEPAVPASLLVPEARQITVLLDHAAAAGLQPEDLR